MYEKPKNEKKMGVTKFVPPLEAPEKRRTFSNFPICEDIKYHYYLIYTPFRRKNEGEFNEALFRFFSSFSTFWKARGTTSYTETCIFRRLILSFNAQKTASGT